MKLPSCRVCRFVFTIFGLSAVGWTADATSATAACQNPLPQSEAQRAANQVVDRSDELPWRQKTTVKRQEFPAQLPEGRPTPQGAPSNQVSAPPVNHVNRNQPPTANPVPVVQDSDVVPASFLLETVEQETNPNPPADSSSGNAPNQLPSSAGQVWREYDIRAYTSRITTTQQPQQAIIDWILKETGTALWFNEPLGILSATRDRLRVYHTPEIHSVVQRIVDQIVQTRGQVQVVGMKMVTVGNPNWRSTAFQMLHPIRVQSPGVQGWMMSKENAAVLFGQLRNRGDFRLIKSGDVTIHDGQKLTVSQLRPIDYYQSIEAVTNRYGLTQWQPVASRIQEGFKLEIGALTSPGTRTIEAVLNCQIDQVEKLQPVRVQVPVQGTPPQSIELQVPQLISWRLEERFRWPADQVLLLSCGVIATPNPDGNGAIDFGKLLNQSRGRADALLFIEYKGPAQNSPIPARQPMGATALRDGGLQNVPPKR